MFETIQRDGEERHLYLYSYTELREKYLEFVALDNDAFMKRLAGALHLACAISLFKELGPDATVGDRGIIHELVHLLHLGYYRKQHLRRIRRKFRDLLKLV